MRLYDPRADIVFRKIFGTHKEMCMSLLNSLLPLEDDAKIVSIEYQDPDMLPDTPDKENTVVDVRCTDLQGRTFLVEMQMYWTDAFLMRSLLNASKAFVAQTQRGMRYENLKPVYSLCLLNDCMPDTREYSDEYTHAYYIQHELHKELKIGGMIFVFVELSKFKSANRVHRRLAELWLTTL